MTSVNIAKQYKKIKHIRTYFCDASVSNKQLAEKKDTNNSTLK